MYLDQCISFALRNVGDTATISSNHGGKMASSACI
jgi:hypothetical protein